jgi:hypothetical protein
VVQPKNRPNLENSRCNSAACLKIAARCSQYKHFVFTSVYFILHSRLLSLDPQQIDYFCCRLIHSCSIDFSYHPYYQSCHSYHYDECSRLFYRHYVDFFRDPDLDLDLAVIAVDFFGPYGIYYRHYYYYRLYCYYGTAVDYTEAFVVVNS